ncbi:hypothetical protein H072_909 [Dactylellina haptotyla CBS 200.50]|uniref:Uncharacterized protein n=1 Tax=Dactylellina haptotyla (strain CBS 200.50) TaxID=1284197 RepID=S8CBQ4_DACHA|nr:hypothetical protein H072_909 [Dactylellina haptotyla CBS 200.50]
MPDNAQPTGTIEFDHVDLSSANENIIIANSSSQKNGTDGKSTDPLNDNRLKLMNILSPDGKGVVFSTAGGNLHIKETSDEAINIADTAIQFSGDAITGRVFFDATGRFFHYYTQTMESYGISRIRLHNTSHVPETASMVMLVPLATPDHPSGAKSLLVAATPKSVVYYIAACNLKDQYTKLFLFKKYPDGLKKLKALEMQNVVTGGEVQDCVMVALTTGANGYSL